MRSAALRRASVRIAALRGLLLLAFLCLAARAGHLAVADSRAERRGDVQFHTTFKLPPARGLIVDRNGVELALTVHAPSIYVLPSEIDDVEGVAHALAGLLDVDAERLVDRIRERQRFLYVARWVDEKRAEAVEALALAGVGVVREPRRAYPGGRLAAHLLGFANIDGQGVRGIEQQENEWLRGSRRMIPVERDARGRLLSRATLTPRDATGGDVALTIDAALQSEAESALERAVAATGAAGGVAVTLDPTSGEILSLAEAPGFDPNAFRKTSFPETRSRAFLDAIEPGSTLKVFLAAAALDTGAVSERDLLDCSEGWLHVPGKTIRDRRPFGELDLSGILRVSSNVGAVQLAQRLGEERHHDALRRFGFGASTDSGFPFESAGLLRPWQSWKPIDHATIAFGQGISVTPIQLAAATASLANGGEWLRPRLVTARRRPNERWRPTPVAPARRVVRRDTARRVLGMMETVVGPGGTGRRAGLRDLRVAGKTGTAQKLDPETHAYSRDRYLAWFIGAVPADDPRLVIAVALDEPQGDAHSGGAVAAPLFAELAAVQLARLGIITRPEPIPAAPPTLLTAGRASSQGEVVRAGERILLPNFRGLTVAEVKQITDENLLELDFLGRGRAIEQSPAPGTILGGAERRVWVRFGPGDAPARSWGEG